MNKRKTKKPRFTTTTIQHEGHTIQTSRQLGDDEDDCSVDEPTPEPKLITVDFDHVEDTVVKTTEPCWGCVYLFGKQKLKNKYKELDMLYDLYLDNRDTMSDWEMAKLLSKTHEEKIHLPEIEAGNLKTMGWTPKQVLTHLKYHMFDERRNVKATIRNYTLIESVIQNAIFVQSEGSDVITPDYQALTAYLNIGNKKLAFIAGLRQLAQ